MTWAIFVVLLSIQAIYGAEYPNLMKHIKVSWGDTDVTANIDSSQTASINSDGDTPAFTLCGPFKNDKHDAVCDFAYSFGFPLGGGFYSASGNGTGLVANFTSKVDATTQCLSFANPIGMFKTVYQSAEVGTGSWKVSYTNCKKYTPIPWGIIVAVVLVIALAIGGFFAYKHFQKKKSAPEQQTQPFISNV